MKQIYQYIILIATVLLAASCSEKNLEALSPVPEPCDLELSFSMPQIELSTKGHFQYGVTGNNLVNDPFSDPSTWTAWERALDGQGMYRLTVLLISKDNGYKVVAYRNIYYIDGSQKGDITPEGDIHGPNGWVSLKDGVNVDPIQTNGREAKMTFLYDNPLHADAQGRSPEKLLMGSYRLVAFANCSACPGVLEGQPDNIPYGGLTQHVAGKEYKFSEYVEGFFSFFNKHYEAAQGIDTYPNYNSFRNWKLENLNNDFVCKPNPQPLTLIQDIELGPGKNQIKVDLFRTYARVRLTVFNNSDHPLTLHNLSFSNNFTKSLTHLFKSPYDDNWVYDIPGSQSGAPSSTSTHALVSFMKDSKVAAHSSHVVFDSYLLESRDKTKPYTYTLDMEYVGQNFKKTSFILPTGYKAIEVHNSADLVDGGDYLIESALYPGHFLMANGTLTNVNTGALNLGTLAGQEVGSNYVWTLEKKGDAVTDANKWYISTSGATKYYIGNPGAYGGVTLGPIRSVSPYFTFGPNGSGNFICMKSSASNNYLNIDYKHDLGGWSDNDNGSSFRFYKLVPTYTSPRYNKLITVKTIDPQTSFATELHTLKRNDFINIHVTVAYNKEKGDFEIEVKDWNKVEGNIEFN